MSDLNSIIIVNLIINALVVLDHFLSRIRRSQCFGNILEMSDSADNKNKSNDKNNLEIIDINKLEEMIKNLKKENDDKKDVNNNKLDKL